MALKEVEKTSGEQQENSTGDGGDAPFFHFAVALAPAPAGVLFVGALHSLRTMSKERARKYFKRR